MPIRKKLLILFLALSLVPLLVLGALSLRTTRSLGTRLAEESHRSRLEREQALVRQTVNDTTFRLADHIRAIRYLLELQVAEVESALSRESSGAEVLWTADFRDGRVEWSDAAGYTRPDGEDAVVPLPVSFDDMLTHLPPGVPWTSSATARQDAGRLEGMAAAYRRARAANPSTVLWQSTVLNSGVHSYYPGHGALRPDRDDREAAWYAGAQESDEMFRGPPSLDPVTGRLVATVARRVRGPDGAVAGVTAIDVSIPQLFEYQGLEAEEWIVRPEVMFLVPEQGRIRVTASHRDGEAFVGEYHEGESDDLLRALEGVRDSGEVGHHQGPYEGRESLWAFRHIPDTQAFLAVNAPVEQVTARLTEAQEFIVAGVRSQMVLLLVCILLVGGAVTLLAYPVATSVTTPLAGLSGTAAAIAEGKLESRARVGRKDEIGSLATSINKMAGSIEDLVNEQEEGVHQMVKALTRALEAKDTYTASHSGCVTNLSRQLGERIGLDANALEMLTRGAQVHDLGKIGVPDAILNKPGPLDDEEFAVMREHVEYTHKIMRPLVRAREFADIARSHHEHWDGSGYPDGLEGEAIPLLARIVAIADSWDAMTGDRCYRKGMPEEKALSILEDEKDQGQWDPRLVREFIEMIRARSNKEPVPA